MRTSSQLVLLPPTSWKELWLFLIHTMTSPGVSALRMSTPGTPVKIATLQYSLSASMPIAT
eukprot:4529974-Pyramimonas_sp.AAC.1